MSQIGIGPRMCAARLPGMSDLAMLRLMTRDAERDYVRRWLETGQLLADLRWRELQALDPVEALRASERLISAALRVPLPAGRRAWSGLVEWQDILHAPPSS